MACLQDKGSIQYADSALRIGSGPIPRFTRSGARLDVAHVQPKHRMRIIVLGIALTPGSALKQCARLNPLEIAHSLPIGYSLPVCLHLSVEEVHIMRDNVRAESGTHHFTVPETLGSLLKAPR